MKTLLPALLLFACAPPATDDASSFSDLSVDLVEGIESVVRVTWEQPAPATAHVRYRADGGPWQETPPRPVEAGRASAHVLGLGYGVDIDLSLVIEDEDGRTESLPQAIATGPLPEGLPLPTVHTNITGAWDASAPYLLNSVHESADDWGGVWWVFIMDREGEIVWAKRAADDDSQLTWVTRHVTITHEGDALLLDQATAWSEFDQGEASTVAKMTLDGEVSHTYDTPRLHHPFTSLPDGQIAWAARGENNSTTETIETVGYDGVQERVWGCGALEAGTCGSNTLWWDEAEDRLLYSFWSSETIAEIDLGTGRLTRELGHTGGAWSFASSSSAFYWQHGPTYTDQGTLLVSSKRISPVEETVVREYVLDEERQQLTEIWTAGFDRGRFGEFGGEAWRLPGGNTLHGLGSGGWLAEYTPAAEVVWEASWPDERRIGQTSTIEDLYELLP